MHQMLYSKGTVPRFSFHCHIFESKKYAARKSCLWKYLHFCNVI